MATWGELEKAGTKWRDLEEMTWGELEEFCVINPKTKQIPDDMEVSFVPMQSVSDTGAVQTDEVRKASEVKKGFTFFEEGDVLFAKITPCMENGKGGIARGLKNGVGFGSTEFHVLHPAPEKVSSEWLYYLTSWDEFRKQCARNMTGSAGQKRVPKSYLEHYKVHLPPLEAQRRIAAVLDKVSDLIAKRREQLDKLDELVKARFVEMFGDNYTNPRNLPILKWDDVFITKTGKLDSNAAVVDGKYPFFTCAKEVLSIDTYAFDQEALLLAGNNAAGKYDVKYYEGRFNAYQRTYVLSLKGNWSYKLFKFQLEEKLDYLQQQSLGGLTKYLTLKILGDLSFLLPPMEDQKIFDEFAAQIDKTKLTIQRSLDKLEVLKKALMQQYFG